MNDPFASLVIRRGEHSDHDRVYSDWLLSFAVSDFAHYLTPRPDWQKKASQLYWTWQRSIIARLLEYSDLWVASWGENVSTIVGWIVADKTVDEDLGAVVHYVYVGEHYRNRGVAKRLLAPTLERARVTFTHRTPLVRHLPVPPGWTYDPRPALVGPTPKEKLDAAQKG